MYIGDIVEDVRKVTACKLILNVCGDNDVDSPRGVLWEARVILSKMINHYQDDLTKRVTEEREFKCKHYDGGGCLGMGEAGGGTYGCAMDPEACSDYEED